MGQATPAGLAAIVGPTASGKSDLALALAAQIPLEILVADSRQVYRGMDIGTAKPNRPTRGLVRHHLVDLAAPDEPFSVADWVSAARPVIDEIIARGRLPLVVGGTGLYVSALVDGYDLGSSPPSAALRRELGQELAEHGPAALAARLTLADPRAAARVDLRNPRRVVRALERGSRPVQPNRPWPGRLLMIGIRRPIEVLVQRINARAERLFSDGLLAEVAGLLAAGYRAELPPMTGHGYREAAAVLAGECTVEEAIETTARRTRQYARRQRTWFRRDPRISWIDADDLPADDPRVVDQARAVLRAAGLIDY